jgi:hypothetical protein
MLQGGRASVATKLLPPCRPWSLLDPTATRSCGAGEDASRSWTLSNRAVSLTAKADHLSILLLPSLTSTLICSSQNSPSTIHLATIRLTPEFATAWHLCYNHAPSSLWNRPSTAIISLGHQTRRCDLQCVVIPIHHRILCFILRSSVYSRFFWTCSRCFSEHKGG